MWTSMGNKEKIFKLIHVTFRALITILDPKTFAESIVSTDGEENLRMVKFHQPRNSILNVLHRLI